MSRIPPESTILLIDNKGSRKFVQLSAGKTTLSKHNINLSFFLDKKLNTFWDVTGDDYKEITEENFTNSEKMSTNEELEYSNKRITDLTNKEFYQGNENQKLSQEEIENMKKNVENKDDIINALIENNVTLDKRTAMSKDKYIKKKYDKYKHFIFITETTICNIVETFGLNEIKEINYLRMDSVATMLVNSNFQEKCHTLIMDESNNILTLAYMKRTKFDSNIVSVFLERINAKNLNILTDTKSTEFDLISHVRYDLLTDESSFIYKRSLGKFSNLVLCLKNDNLLPKYFFSLLKFLKFSGNFALFSKGKEVLIEIDKHMITNKLGFDTKIIETVTREYQILELRTHPMMNHKGFSGFVYVGYRAYNEN